MQNKGANKRVSNITQLAEKYAQPVIELPGWEPEEPLVCRVKRPSMYHLAQQEMIPNPLMEPIRKLFFGAEDKAKPLSLEREAEAMLWIADQVLVEPTRADLEAAGLTLTDPQLAAIYTYAVGGAALLAPFRPRQGRGADADDAAVPGAAQPTHGD